MTPLPPGVRRVSGEVLYSDRPLVSAEPELIRALQAMAEASPKRRARLCAHPDPAAEQQEMVIVMTADGYVRPHRHWGKSETLTVLEGEMDALVFDEDGQVSQVLPMAPCGAGKAFFYRMPEGVFHTLWVRSSWLVFLETTKGPFDPASSESASWAPPEEDVAAGRRFIADALQSA